MCYFTWMEMPCFVFQQFVWFFFFGKCQNLNSVRLKEIHAFCSAVLTAGLSSSDVWNQGIINSLSRLSSTNQDLQILHKIILDLERCMRAFHSFTLQKEIRITYYKRGKFTYFQTFKTTTTSSEISSQIFVLVSVIYGRMYDSKTPSACDLLKL